MLRNLSDQQFRKSRGSLVCRQHRPRGVLQRSQVPVDYLLDVGHRDAEVLVRQQVTQSCDLLPWHLRARRSGRISETFDGLTDDHEVVEDRVPSDPLALLRARMRPNGTDRVEDVLETLAIRAFQSGRASRSTRVLTSSLRISGVAASTGISRIASASC